MSAMDLSRYRQLYVTETQENLEKLSRLLVELESRPADRQAVDSVFRLVHSIKGMSGTMGYSPVFELAHVLEDLMDHFRRSRAAVGSSSVDVLLAGLDRMGQWVADIEAERLPLEADEASRDIERRAREQLARLQAETTQPNLRVLRVSGSMPALASGELRVNVEIGTSATDPAVRALLVLRRLAEIGEVRACRPEPAALRAGRLDTPLSVTVATAWPAQTVETWLRLLPDLAHVEVRAADARAAPVPQPTTPARSASEDDFDLTFSGDLAPPAPPEATPSPARPRVVADDFDAFEVVPTLPPISEPPVSFGPEQTPGTAASLDAFILDVDEATPVVEPAAGGVSDLFARSPEAAIVRPARASRAVRVRTDWLDGVLHRTADLLIIAQRLWGLERTRADPALSQAVADLSRGLNELHSDALSVRMTPLSVLTGRLPRAVRDLGRKCGKQVTLVLRGEDQALDRAIIEGLDAPLTHLVTNAVEHGIETPDARVRAGKPPGGTLTLECSRIQDEIVLELADDGAGVDREKLASRAAALGLLPRERAFALAQTDLVRLLCLPGLTTRDRPGDNAGRGVGLDAVRESVHGLGGLVEVVSEQGRGTLVRLRLPRTAGIARMLLVDAGGQCWGLPLARVTTSLVFEASAVETGAEGLRVDWSGAHLPLFDLGALLERRPSEAPTRAFTGIVHASVQGPFVVVVDRIVGQQEAVLRTLGPLLECIDGLMGVTLDAQGVPIFLLDLPRVLSRPVDPPRGTG